MHTYDSLTMMGPADRAPLVAPTAEPLPLQRETGRRRTTLRRQEQRERLVSCSRSSAQSIASLDTKISQILEIVQRLIPPHVWPMPIADHPPPFLTWVAKIAAPEPQQACAPSGESAQLSTAVEHLAPRSGDIIETIAPLAPSLASLSHEQPVGSDMQQQAPVEFFIGDDEKKTTGRSLRQHPSDPSTCCPLDTDDVRSVAETEVYDPFDDKDEVIGISFDAALPEDEVIDISLDTTLPEREGDASHVESLPRDVEPSTYDPLLIGHDIENESDGESEVEDLHPWPPCEWPGLATVLIQFACDFTGAIYDNIVITVKPGHNIAHMRELVHRQINHPVNDITVHAISDAMETTPALDNKLKLKFVNTNRYFVVRIHGQPHDHPH